MSEHSNRANPKPPSVDRLSFLWRRINDHKMVQWSVAYVALAYGVQHAVTLITEAFEWPHAVERVSMLLLALGLPLVITLAWYHGARASRRISGPELTIISILLVMSSLLFYVFVRPSAELAAPAAQQAGVTAARSASSSPKGAISLAVLPFVNLSSDKEQEFFSDGMTEEITAALAKVPDLRVVARTSAFEFKGKNVNIKTMGDELGATHLIEGSVRKAGNRLRITAQLIKADDGTHIWAEDYDRELTDVFAIQEDIARAITASLHMTLGLKPGENLVNNRNVDPESHENFLRAKALYDGREGAIFDYMQVESLLRDIINKNSEYAPAWALLAAVYFERANNNNGSQPIAIVRAQVNELRMKGEAAARRAIDADPNLPAAYTALASFAWTRAKPIETEEMYLKALALDPADASVLDGYGIRLGVTGRLKDALASFEKAHALEPFLPGTSRRTAMIYWIIGQNDSAIALAKTLRPTERAPLLATIYASMGQYGEAADTLADIAGDPNSILAQAARLLRGAPGSGAAPETLPRLPRELDFIYLHVGAPGRALDVSERMAEIDYFNSLYPAFVWHPSYAAVRKTERFKAFVRKAGLFEYWRAKGWPPQCHPTAGEDFECS